MIPGPKVLKTISTPSVLNNQRQMVRNVKPNVGNPVNPGVPTNALTYGGEPLTYGGEPLTYGVAA